MLDSDLHTITFNLVTFYAANQLLSAEAFQVRSSRAAVPAVQQPFVTIESLLHLPPASPLDTRHLISIIQDKHNPNLDYWLEVGAPVSMLTLQAFSLRAPPPLLATRTHRSCLVGLTETEDGVLAVIDLQKLFTKDHSP